MRILTLLLAISLSACSTGASSTASTPPVTITTTVRVTDPGSTATTTIAVPVQQPPRVETVTVTLAPPAPAAAISEGVWTVGVDIAPGVYRTIAPVGGRCYWATLKTGSNGEIIANAIVEGGRPQVTLKVGQDFETTRCGDWAKIG